MKKLLSIALAFLLLLSFTASAFAQTTYEQVVKNFWSPVTPSHTLAYCPGADDTRQELKDLIAQGKSEQEIIDIFVAKYGEAILQLPPKEGFFLSAWIMPIVGLLAGIGMVYLFIGNRKKTTLAGNNNTAVGEIADFEIDKEMKKYL